MYGVVLAAGRGTRLRPLTDSRPKGLVEVDERPVLDYCFDELVDLGVEHIVTVVGYRAGQIRDQYGESYADVPITYVTQERQRGLAHALLAAESVVSEPFVLLLGDNVFDANLREVVDRFHEANADASCLVETVPEEEAGRYGVCVTDDEGRITRLVEKPDDPPSNLVLTGFYVFDPLVFHACHLVTESDRGELELTDAIDLLIDADHRVSAVQLRGERVDIGYPEDIERAEQIVRD